jgi:hypothetical protein
MIPSVDQISTPTFVQKEKFLGYIDHEQEKHIYKQTTFNEDIFVGVVRSPGNSQRKPKYC